MSRVKPWIIVLVAFLVLAVFGSAVFLAFKMGQDSSSETGRDTLPARETDAGRGMVVTPENVELSENWAKTPVSDGSYRVRMNMTWNFPDGRSNSSNAYVENAEANKRTVYFDVFLGGTNELIYSSPFIPVTGRLDEIKLNKELVKGEYPAVLTYHLVDDNYEEITTLSVNITINIEK